MYKSNKKVRLQGYNHTKDEGIRALYLMQKNTLPNDSIKRYVPFDPLFSQNIHVAICISFHIFLSYILFSS